MVLKIFRWEVCSTNLLRDTACLTSLNFRLPQFVKYKCLSSVYVTHNTYDWTAEFACLCRFLLLFRYSLIGRLWSFTCEYTVKSITTNFFWLFLFFLSLFGLFWLLLFFCVDLLNFWFIVWWHVLFFLCSWMGLWCLNVIVDYVVQCIKVLPII